MKNQLSNQSTVVDELVAGFNQIKQCKIDMGPDKFELMTGFFAKEVKTTFRINTGAREIVIQCQVNTIQAEDGSRESWNIEGEVLGIRTPIQFHDQWTVLPRGRKFKGYFHTRSHEGHIKF